MSCCGDRQALQLVGGEAEEVCQSDKDPTLHAFDFVFGVGTYVSEGIRGLTLYLALLMLEEMEQRLQPALSVCVCLCV